jgi:CHAD domain-containing protein
MPPSRKSVAKTAAGAKPARRQRPSPNPRLNGSMACDTAFRVVARRHLESLCVHQEATSNGDPTALHHMRIALTHLRTAILFFSPMVDDAIRGEIRDELKWLNTELGAVRDLDVAVERVKSLNDKRPQALPAFQSWNEKRAEGHRQLARMLRSVRYGWLIERTLVHKDGQAGDEAARRSNRRLQRRKDRGMGGEAPEKEPQASQDGDEETA